MPKEIYKNITVDGREFVIRKFDAKTGLKIARLVIAKAAPLIPLIESATGKGTTDARIFAAVGEILGTLDDADMDSLIDKCLRSCFENLPAGLAPVIDETGNFGVEGVEYDMLLTLKLCFEAIKWGASDFFGENLSNLRQIIPSVG